MSAELLPHTAAKDMLAAVDHMLATPLVKRRVPRRWERLNEARDRFAEATAAPLTYEALCALVPDGVVQEVGVRRELVIYTGLARASSHSSKPEEMW